MDKQELLKVLEELGVVSEFYTWLMHKIVFVRYLICKLSKFQYSPQAIWFLDIPGLETETHHSKVI